MEQDDGDCRVIRPMNIYILACHIMSLTIVASEGGARPGRLREVWSGIYRPGYPAGNIMNSNGARYARLFPRQVYYSPVLLSPCVTPPCIPHSLQAL